MSTPPSTPNSGVGARSRQMGLDPRSPRFGAGISAVLLLTVITLTLLTPMGTTILLRASEPGFVLFAFLAVLFGWAAIAGLDRHPYGLIFRALVSPRLSPPTELRDPGPVAFSQGLGFVIALAGVTLHLLGVPYGLLATAGTAFAATVLNSVFGYCLGCQIHSLLLRAGLVGRTAAAPPSDA